MSTEAEIGYCPRCRRTYIDADGACPDCPRKPVLVPNPPPAPGRENVTDALVAYLREREAKGLDTYGCRLQSFNGRDALTDALEEALDLVQYLFQAKLERAALEAEVKALRSSAGYPNE